MFDYFHPKGEPMEIEGEARCAEGVQPVTAEGEQEAGVEHRNMTGETTSLIRSNCHLLCLTPTNLAPS